MTAWIAAQYLLPHRLLSWIVRRATRWTWGPWKRLLIRQVAQKFRIDLSEAQIEDAGAYPHFNAFFTRALKPDARWADSDPQAVLSPADGTVSQLGAIQSGRIFQAKGHWFSVQELLGGDAAECAPWQLGQFATIYLSPRDYHRLHMPLGGRLLRTRHVPGRLFSVAAGNIDGVPRLFARNERLVCWFETPAGPMVLVLVGALLVSGIETVWGGIEVPPYASRITNKDYTQTHPPIQLGRFMEMGRFNMGSTVILLLPQTAMVWKSVVGDPIQVGQALGYIEPR